MVSSTTAESAKANPALTGYPLSSFRVACEPAAAAVGLQRRLHVALRLRTCACRAMSSIKDLDSTAIYAYTTLISVLICVPAAAIFEGPHLKAAADKAAAAHPDFYMSLFLVGLLYHLYNQACSLLPCTAPARMRPVRAPRSGTPMQWKQVEGLGCSRKPFSPAAMCHARPSVHLRALQGDPWWRLGVLQQLSLELECVPVQFAFNTLSRVSPVSHGVCNVVRHLCRRHALTCMRVGARQASRG